MILESMERSFAIGLVVKEDAMADEEKMKTVL